MPGASVTAPTAYLSSGGFAAANIMGVIDGELYSLSTADIDKSEGILPLETPPSTEYYHPASFAYCGGKVYICEKTPGSSDCYFRFRVCDKDSGNSEVIFEDERMDSYLSWDSMDFTVEGNYICWDSYMNGSQVPTLLAYDMKEGKLITDGSANVPFSKMVHELKLTAPSYGSDIVVSQVDENTWTLWAIHYDLREATLEAYTVIRDKTSGAAVTTDIIRYGEIPRAYGMFAAYEGYLYVSDIDGADGVLYKFLVDGETVHERIELGRHVQIGGGDAFFGF